jgi:phosphoribosylglycinamide formyltransferase-1
VIQYRITVRADEPIDSLVARVHAGEHVILPRAVDWFVTGRLRLVGGAVMLDGKRLQEPVIVEGE